MKISFYTEEVEILGIQNFIENNQGPFTQRRIRRNINREGLSIDKDIILKAIMMCLLTSQQRSGPNSPVAQFLRLTPFPITYDQVKQERDVKKFIMEKIEGKGIRFPENIGTYLEHNFQYHESNDWEIVETLKEVLEKPPGRAKERELVRKILKKDKKDKRWIGIGPKQSRNFLQVLGISQYETPIDSRIVKWLKARDFPIPLSSGALSDNGYYEFVVDAICELCAMAEVFPCVLDAAIFSSFDGGKWTEENAIF